jgi:hypothetical protein
MSTETVSGTIQVRWTISERDLQIAHIERELTPAELSTLYDRIGELVVEAFSQRATIWIDGEDKPPADVHLEVNETDIEIDDGPVNGRLEDLRTELEGASASGSDA